MVVAMSRTIVGTPDSVKGKTVTEFKTSPIEREQPAFNYKNYAFPETRFLPIFDGSHLRRAIAYYMEHAHRYFIKGTMTERDLRIMAHNIKRKAKVFNLPIPDDFDLQLQPDTFVMS